MNKTAGDLLREARTKKGLALQTIERSTGIATHNLLAMELDQFALIDADKLDQYLRAYADAVDLDYTDLGLSEEATLAELTEPLAEEPAEVTSFDDLVKSEDPYHVPTAVTPSTLRRSGRTSHSVKQTEKKSFIAPMLTMLVLAALIFGVFFLYKNHYFDAFLPSQTTKETETSLSSSTSQSSSETPASSEPAPVAPATQLAVTGGGEALDVVVTTTQTPVKVEISFAGTGSSWVALSNSDLGEGGTTLSSEQPTYTATLIEGASQATLSLGITEGITVKVNDQVLDLSALTSTAYSTITFNIQ